MEGFSSSLCFRPICCESAIMFSNVIWSCCFAGARRPWHRLVAQFSTKALRRQTGWREELSILKVMIRLRFARKSTLDSASQTLPPNQCYYRTWVTCYRPARPNTIQYLQFIRHQPQKIIFCLWRKQVSLAVYLLLNDMSNCVQVEEVTLEGRPSVREVHLQDGGFGPAKEAGVQVIMMGHTTLNVFTTTQIY